MGHNILDASRYVLKIEPAFLSLGVCFACGAVSLEKVVRVGLQRGYHCLVAHLCLIIKWDPGL